MGCALILAVFLALPGDGVALDRLVTGSERDRALAEAKLREDLTLTEAKALIERMDGLSLALRLILYRILSSGGPWTPALVQGLASDGGAPGHCVRALLLSLRNRPIPRDLPDPETVAVGIIDPFGNGVPGEGKALFFPAPWPGPITLDRLLDRINEAARPTHAFVVSPSLGDGADDLVRTMPMEGPAPLVIDRVLREHGLGVVFLESIALVEPGSGPCFGVFRQDEKPDRVLLDQALSVLKNKASTLKARRRALKALAYLDLPGLFQGYLDALKQGAFDPAVDVLLYGPCFERLESALASQGDRKLLDGLIEAFWKMDLGDERRARLHRLFDRLEISVYAGSEAKALSLLRDGDDRQRIEGLCASLSLARKSPSYRTRLLPILSAWRTDDPLTLYWINRVLLASSEEGVGDHEIAGLLENPVTRPGALELAWTKGGRETLEILLRQQGTPQDAVLAAALWQRLRGEEVMALPLDSPFHAGVAAALGAGQEQEAAAFLLDGIDAGVALPFFALFDDGRILPYLPRLCRALASSGSTLKPLFEETVVRSVSRSSLAAERVRLALLKLEAPWIGEGLNRSLSLLSSLSSLDSMRVAVDF